MVVCAFPGLPAKGRRVLPASVIARGRGAVFLDAKFRVLLGDLGILTVAFIWGTANAVIRSALDGITPLWFCAFRFVISFVSVAVFFGFRAWRLPRGAKAAGTMIGTVFVSGYILGAVALLYTTAGNESFIISMSVVFVPVAVWFFRREFPGWHVVAAVALCVAGMANLSLSESLSVNVGDLLCFAAMLCVTANILLVQKFVRNADACGLACWQALGGMLLALAAALFFEPFPKAIPAASLIAIVYTGTIGFALTLVLQNVAQKHTSATHAAILLSTSGVFGSAAGVLVLGEPMTWRIFIAGALILTGVLLAEAVPAMRRGMTVRNTGKAPR